MRKLMLFFVGLAVIAGCQKSVPVGGTETPVDDVQMAPSPSPSEVPVIPTPLPPSENLPTTSILIVVDESHSITYCSVPGQQFRHQIPQFYFAFHQLIQNPNLKLGVSIFNRKSYYSPIIKFEDSFTNSTDWYPKIENIAPSDFENEDYGESIKKGLQDLADTGSESQILLLLTDGSYLSPDSAKNKINSAVDNLKDNQKISVLLLCPESPTVGDLGVWSQIDANKDSVTVSKTTDDDWFSRLAENTLGKYLEIGADYRGWISSNADISFNMPSDHNFKISAISLTRGNIGIEPRNENMNQNITPNMFYDYQNAEPNATCSPYQGRLINYTGGDVFYWIIKEKLDINLVAEIVSDPKLDPVRLATSLTMPGKSNADLINLLSCYKLNISPAQNINSSNLKLLHPTSGYCLDGLCAEPSRLVSYWEWNDTVPLVIDAISISDRSSGDVIYSESGADVMPAPFIYKFEAGGPFQDDDDVEPYYKIQFQIWYSDVNVENIAIHAVSDLTPDRLTAVGAARNNDGRNAPLCPLTEPDKDFVDVVTGELSINNQIVRGIDSNGIAAPQLSEFFIKVYRAVGWHRENDDDPVDSLPHCNYYTYLLLWNSIQWECNFLDDVCRPIVNP